MATKKIEVFYYGFVSILEKGKYVDICELIAQDSLKMLYNTAKKFIKKEYKSEYKDGRRFYVRKIYRYETRLIDTAAKEITIKI
jgi:hypothetical protein